MLSVISESPAGAAAPTIYAEEPRHIVIVDNKAHAIFQQIERRPLGIEELHRLHIRCNSHVAGRICRARAVRLRIVARQDMTGTVESRSVQRSAVREVLKVAFIRGICFVSVINRLGAAVAVKNHPVISVPARNRLNAELHPAFGDERFPLVVNCAPIVCIVPEPKFHFRRCAAFLQHGHFEVVRQLHTVKGTDPAEGIGYLTPAAGVENRIVPTLRHFEPDSVQNAAADLRRKETIAPEHSRRASRVFRPADKDIAIPRERIVPQVERFFLRIDNYFLLCHPIQRAAVALECDRHVFPIAIQSRHQSIGILIAPIGNSLFAGNWKTIRNSRIALNAHITGSKI